MFQSAGGLEVRAVRRVCIPLADGDGDGRKTVLLVTADANLRAAAARVLAGAGYAVLTAAHSGHATLAALAGGRIDILASDLDMDDIPGPALAARLRRQHPALQALFFSDRGTPNDPDLLVRPFTREEFLGAITAIA
jgi:two-component system, cell cycle sensor histidine kinase and response regulator CckA